MDRLALDLRVGDQVNSAIHASATCPRLLEADFWFTLCSAQVRPSLCEMNGIVTLRQTGSLRGFSDGVFIITLLVWALKPQ